MQRETAKCGSIVYYSHLVVFYNFAVKFALYSNTTLYPNHECLKLYIYNNEWILKILALTSKYYCHELASWMQAITRNVDLEQSCRVVL